EAVGPRAKSGNPQRKYFWPRAFAGAQPQRAHSLGARRLDLTGERTVPLMRSLLQKHPNLYMSVKLDETGSRRTSPFGPDNGLKPGWLMMLRDFPDRFVIGSDQFFDEGSERITLARKFIDALPPE